jgi:hypothetical protein
VNAVGFGTHVNVHVVPNKFIQFLMFPDIKVDELVDTILVQSCIAAFTRPVSVLSGSDWFNPVTVAHEYVHTILNISTHVFMFSGLRFISCHVKNSSPL